MLLQSLEASSIGSSDADCCSETPVRFFQAFSGVKLTSSSGDNSKGVGSRASLPIGPGSGLKFDMHAGRRLSR
ncbi:MAG: hypothetical protein C3F11_05320 [Methylocystaceae bacterium]|nr:MAG: hypothetical protein C3F11_05320 [Methylocystaceae bacterium]